MAKPGQDTQSAQSGLSELKLELHKQQRRISSKELTEDEYI